MTQIFELAPWRSPLSRAIHLNRSQAHHRFLQLATVTPGGQPRNRTVVFRGFMEQTNLFELRGNPQNRYIYTQDTDHHWQKIEVNP